MNTPAHVIIALAAFARPHDRPRTCAAVAGALAPDASLYLMASWALLVQGHSTSYVFDQLYFSDAWMHVFRIDNSFLIWGAGLLVAWTLSAYSWMVFAAAGLLHLALDLPLHHDDGRPHFWPLSDWIYESPLSYWDTAHYAGFIGPIEVILCLILCAILLVRYTSLRSRLVISGLVLTQVSPAFFWVFVFTSGYFN